ncbi:hypothetical protein ACFTWH_26610 [Streptomyces sp. NPDC057011]|uniref:hypothetical protein n=1 Tax=unclassified Streptomyces TaxID=2593676 RepID=UPI003638F94E
MSQTEHEQRAQEQPEREPAAAPLEQFTLLAAGVVELRKRGDLATRRAGSGNENPLEAMARRAAERIAAEGRPCA